MTLDERYKKAEQEFKEIAEWRWSEEEKKIQRLKSEGKALGLDGCSEEFAPIRQECIRKILEIYDKYELPNKPNFDRWLK